MIPRNPPDDCGLNAVRGILIAIVPALAAWALIALGAWCFL